MKKTILIFYLVFFVSCVGSKRSSIETDIQNDISVWQKQQNDKVVLETLETTIDFFGTNTNGEGFKPSELKPRQLVNDELQAKTQPIYTVTTKKTVKTEDKGTIETTSEDNTHLQVDQETKQNPWRPPWYVSGLAVLALLVVYKVFKAKFQIVKRIKEL